jgi:ankyrin repeat protein
MRLGTSRCNVDRSRRAREGETLLQASTHRFREPKIVRPAPSKFWFGLCLLSSCASTVSSEDSNRVSPPAQASAIKPGSSASAELVDAAARGDLAETRRFLDVGADANSRDEEGATALMRAAQNGQPQAVSVLLARGADPNLANRAGATALMWGVGNARVVELLLDHGADPNAKPASGHTALVIAANSDGTADVAKLLVSRGADVNAASIRGFTPLHSASLSGDPKLVQLLLEKGADPKAANRLGWTALHSATSMGNPAIVRALVDAGTPVNEGVNGVTPLMWAAAGGSSEIVELLLRRGAKATARETFHGGTPLIWAAASGNAENVKLLLAVGADAKARDDDGNTAYQWAVKQGDSSVTKLFGKAPPSVRHRVANVAGVENNTAEAAISRSLPLLQRSSSTFVSNAAENCVSCHHQSLPALAFQFARERGFQVEERAFEDIASATQAELAPRREQLMLGMGVPDPLDPAYLLLALGQAKRKTDRTIDALVHFLTLKQRRDGRWSSLLHRPPIDDSDFTSTAISLHALALYAPPARRAEITDRIRRATNWLKTAAPKTTEDRALQLLGLAWGNAGDVAMEHRASELLAIQRSDGGWSQTPGLTSDAYATGEALVALHESGQLRAEDAAYVRGITFLLRMQLPDGSWFVQTRSLPIQPYFESGFPHGKSQFISCAATSWAVMALALSVPTKTAERQ